MYGSSSKLGGRGGGRGGGAGGTKRLSSSFPPPPHRPSTATTASRLSLGGGGSSNPRSRSGPNATNSGGPAVEETFSLIPGNNPLAFAMIIRLAPDLVDEIRRVEAQGGNARIKFDNVATNPTGNVIDVGGKEFRFTWSKEFGDLCDIYEERQSGEDGNGLLVESGCAWRKVNVQRVLDESTTNHVKMRSEEAERKHKSRKAIVLEHGNPSMKSQLKQLAAVESNPWRMGFKKKDPPFKKRKVETAPVGGPHKSTVKPGLASNASAKGRRSSSPLPSPEQFGAVAPASPFGTGNTTKSQVNTEEILPSQMKSKENAGISEKEIHGKTNSAVRETPGHKGNPGPKPTDLQSMLFTLLVENPKGMSLKQLEKAVGDTFPNSAKKIEPIIKKIATVEAPGRYILKAGVELESIKKPSLESGSSSQDRKKQTPAPDDNQDQRPASEPRFVEKNPTFGLEEQTYSNSKLEEESNAPERIDIQQQSPDLFGEKKVSDNSEGQADSSSDSGSDSDSDSDSSDSGSDSGSHSRSRSRSRSKSPAASRSGSSSDSESDASSNSKEGSDEDVDIMTSDDDKEPQHKVQPSEPGFSASPEAWRSTQNGADEKQEGDDGFDAIDVEGHESDAVDIDKDSADEERDIEMAGNDSLIPMAEGEEPVEVAKTFSHQDIIQERQTFIGNLFDDSNVGRDSYRNEQSDGSERSSKGKSKRGPDKKHHDEKFEGSKRLKAENLAQAPISVVRDAQFSGSPHNRHVEDTYKDAAIQVTTRADREGSADLGLQKGYNLTPPGKPSSDFQQSARRSSDQEGWAKAPDTTGRSKHTDSSGHGRKISDKVFDVHENFPAQRERASRDIQSEDFPKGKKVPRNPKEGGSGGRHSASLDSHYRKQGATFGKSKDAAQLPSSHMGSSPKDGNRFDMDKYPAVSGRSLQRELSDLELGELREPLPEETPVKKQFEKKGSFKFSENKPSTSDNYIPDLSKGKPVGKAALDSTKSSSPNRSTGVYAEDLTRSQHKAGQHHLQHVSKMDNVEVGTQFSKLADTNTRSRQNEAVSKLGNSMEGYGESQKKAPSSAQQLQDSKRPHSIKESKAMSTKTTNLMEGQKDAINNGSRKRMESASDEDSSSYSKYEKEAPELKGPIMDFSQYKDYVQEFHEKYDGYCSLNKILESYRNEFQKLGKDLELSKGRDTDRYHKTLTQLKESYRQCGARHKRLKKIFVVLHEELENLKQRIKDYVQSKTRD